MIAALIALVWLVVALVLLLIAVLAMWDADRERATNADCRADALDRALVAEKVACGRMAAELVTAREQLASYEAGCAGDVVAGEIGEPPLAVVDQIVAAAYAEYYRTQGGQR